MAYGTYLSIRVRPEDEFRLRKMADDIVYETGQIIHFTEAVEPLHITVMYDETNEYKPIPTKILNNIIAVAKGVEIFTGCNSSRYLVLPVECTYADMQNSNLKAMGYVHGYPEYHPHITLGKVSEYFNLNTIPNKRFKGMIINLDREVCEPIKRV